MKFLQTIKPNKNNIFRFYIPSALFLVAVIWKILYVGARDICIDEPFTIFYAQDSLLDILKLPTQNEPNPPLFMLLLHFWIKLFGIGAHSVRILPILFNGFTVVFIYLTGKRFFNIWSAITASMLFIFSTYHFYFGGDTRTYSMLSFATASSLYYLLSIQKEPEKIKYLLGFVISNLFLIYGHYFGLLVVFMQMIIGLFCIRNKKVFTKVSIGLISTGLLYIPMLPVLFKQFFISKKGTWVTPPPNSEYLHQLNSFLNANIGLKVVGFILGAGIILAIFTKFKKGQLKDLSLLLIWWIIPYSIMFFISSKIPMFTNRYILFNSIGFYLFIAVSISLLFQRIRFLGPALSFVLIVVVYTNLNTADYATRKIKDTAEYARSKMDDKTSIILYPHWSDLGFMYYFNPEIFKLVADYGSKLSENNIYRTWGIDDTRIFVENNMPPRILLYQDNTPSVDPKNELFNYLDSIYERTDSMAFVGGTVVSIFEATANEY